MRFLPLVLLACLAVRCAAEDVPRTLTLKDGRVLDQVTSIAQEDGKIRVAHASGVSRLLPAELSADSLAAMGIDGNAPVLPELTRIVTSDGAIYEDVRQIRLTPTAISFLHKDGSARVKLEKLPEPLRLALKYDPAAAREFDAKEVEADRQAEAEWQTALKESGDAQARRKAAVCYLESKGYGGPKYWAMEAWFRRSRDRDALRILSEAGYPAEEAEKVMSRMQKEGEGKKFRPAGFPAQVGELRSSPGPTIPPRD